MTDSDYQNRTTTALHCPECGSLPGWPCREWDKAGTVATVVSSHAGRIDQLAELIPPATVEQTSGPGSADVMDKLDTVMVALETINNRTNAMMDVIMPTELIAEPYQPTDEQVLRFLDAIYEQEVVEQWNATSAEFTVSTSGDVMTVVPDDGVYAAPVGTSPESPGWRKVADDWAVSVEFTAAQPVGFAAEPVKAGDVGQVVLGGLDQCTVCGIQRQAHDRAYNPNGSAGGHKFKHPSDAKAKNAADDLRDRLVKARSELQQNHRAAAIRQLIYVVEQLIPSAMIGTPPSVRLAPSLAEQRPDGSVAPAPSGTVRIDDAARTAEAADKARRVSGLLAAIETESGASDPDLDVIRGLVHRLRQALGN